MKKLLILSACIATLGSILASCSKDSESPEYRITYGMVNEIYSDYAIILTDEGASLRVVENATGLELKPEDRIVFNYTVIQLTGNQPDVALPGTPIRLNEAEKILCKTPVKESFVLENEQHRRDSLGTDPIEVYYAWFGGKYLNVRFGIAAAQNTDVIHQISLVYEDRPRNAMEYPYKELTLYHNAHGDLQGSIGIGYISFDISSLGSAGLSGVNIRLKWKDYSGAERSDEGTFQPYASSQATAGILQPGIAIK